MIKNIYYDTLAEFIQIKDKCIFCKQSLSPVLANFFVGHGRPRIPDLNVLLGQDYFKFRLKYDGESLNFNVNASVNIKDNRFSFFYYNSDIVSSDRAVVSVFENMRPYVELVCQNKECGINYCLQSDFLHIDVEKGNHIKTTTLMLEALVVDNWWVANYYNANYPTCGFTWIHSRNRPDAQAISYKRLDFESFSKEKLINRIKTIVTFS
jgi:hypothetical protein